jgi:hypothetical protein
MSSPLINQAVHEPRCDHQAELSGSKSLNEAVFRSCVITITLNLTARAFPEAPLAGKDPVTPNLSLKAINNPASRFFYGY